MKETVDILVVAKKNALLLIGLCLTLYFSYHMAFGRYSYSRFYNIAPIVSMKEKQLAALEQKSVEMESRVKLLRPDTLSPDMLEEQSRYILGYNTKNEMVIVKR